MPKKVSKPPKPPAGGHPEGGEYTSSKIVRTGLILGTTFGIKAVQYAVVDGLAIFEGDIVLGTEQEVADQTESLRQTRTGEVALGVVITGAQFRWPNCRIPYDIDPALPNQVRVTDAISHWESRTPYRFVLRTAANASTFPDYVTFRSSTGCSSSVGRRGGQQFVNLGGGCSTGNAIHEIGHVTGLWHEQSRQDRDSFVTIHWAKIQPGFEHNFDQHVTDGDDVGAYDYGSIMHYPRDAFSVDGSDTITPLNPATAIGQRVSLSAGDIAAATSLCPKPLKEGPKDGIFDTRKEVIKDIRLDTRKELIFDTLKEAIRDPITRKEAALDPPFLNPGNLPRPLGQRAGGVGTGGGPVQPGGDLPFALATPHQAPGAGSAQAGPAEAVSALDAQLQALAEALAEAEAVRTALQQQYDETAALLKQALDAHEEGTGRERQP